MRKISLYIIIFFLTGNVFGQLQFDSVYINNPDNQDGLISVMWDIDTSLTWDSVVIYRKTDVDTSFIYRNKVDFDTVQYIDDSLCGVDVKYLLRLFQSGILMDSDSTDQVPENDTPPEIPILYALNYINDSIKIEWKETVDITAIGYTIYQWDDGIYPIQDIDNPNETTFKISDSVSPCNKQDKLLMITRDVCSGSPNQFEAYLQSLTLIDTLTYDTCGSSITIVFDEYITADGEGLNQSILNHEIWVSENGGDSAAIDTVPPGTTQFVHEGISSGSDYKYTIKTVIEVNGDTVVNSFCCPDSILTQEIPLPAYFSFQNATVTSANEVNLFFEADTSADITGFRLYRTDADDETQLVAEIEEQEDIRWSYTDTTATPETESYRYFAEVIDECGLDAMPAAHPSSTVFLTVTTEDTENKLEWSAYEGWEVENYVVYRFGNGYDTTEVAMVSGTTYTLTDTPSANPAEGQWHYYVVAVSAEGPEESHSNAASANRATFFRVPTAFRPAGNTSYVFKPVFVSLPPSGYQLLIYNRWGQLIYETTDPEQGWDGTFEGDPAPMGTYVYFIRYSDNNNQPNEEKGTVVLIR